jgi:hypothetical protein
MSKGFNKPLHERRHWLKVGSNTEEVKQGVAVEVVVQPESIQVPLLEQTI